MKLGHEGDIYYSQKFVVDERRRRPPPDRRRAGPPGSGAIRSATA